MYKHASSISGNDKPTKSLFFDLLPHFVFIHDFLEFSESFGGVVEDVLLLDSLAYDLIEDDLEAYGDAAAFEIGVVLFSDFLYLWVLFADALAFH